MAEYNKPLVQPLGGYNLHERIISMPWHSREYRGKGKVHAGIDFRAEIGTPVYAMADGQIITADADWVPGNGKPGGNQIIIDHGLRLDKSKRVASGYMHLSKLLVKKGDRVLASTLIGYSGDTGGRRSNPTTGQLESPMRAHLHFQIMTYDGAWTADPALAMPYFDRLTSDPEGSSTLFGLFLRKLLELKFAEKLVPFNARKWSTRVKLPEFNVEEYEERQKEEQILKEVRRSIEKWKKQQADGSAESEDDPKIDLGSSAFSPLGATDRMPRLFNWFRRRPTSVFNPNDEYEKIRIGQDQRRSATRMAEETRQRNAAVVRRIQEESRRQAEKIAADQRDQQAQAAERERQRRAAADRIRDREQDKYREQQQRDAERRRQEQARAERQIRNNFRVLNPPKPMPTKSFDTKKAFYRPDKLFPQTKIYMTQVGVQRADGSWSRTYFNSGKLLGKL